MNLRFNPSLGGLRVRAVPWLAVTLLCCSVAHATAPLSPLSPVCPVAQEQLDAASYLRAGAGVPVSTKEQGALSSLRSDMDWFGCNKSSIFGLPNSAGGYSRIYQGETFATPYNREDHLGTQILQNCCGSTFA